MRAIINDMPRLRELAFGVGSALAATSPPSADHCVFREGPAGERHVYLIVVQRWMAKEPVVVNGVVKGTVITPLIGRSLDVRFADRYADALQRG